MKIRPNPANWPNIPAELRERRQWLLATPDAKGDLKVPTSLDATGQPVAGSSTDPRTWLDFDVACRAAAQYRLAIGYVVAKDDPFTCVDLDIKNYLNEADPAKWSSDEDVAVCTRIVEQLFSYTERSQSGIGLHVWVRAKIGDGVKRKPVEVYSQGRFLVCTGDVVLNQPIAERQAIVDLIVAEARKAQADHKAQLDEGKPERYSDEEIVERLGSQANADKYFALYKGLWQDLGFPSQSEADLALMSMYTFLSENNEQCRRLFRMSALGKREKATKNDVYLNRTLQIIRGRQERESAATAHGESIAAALLAQARTQDTPQAPNEAPQPHTPTAPPAQAPVAPTPPAPPAPPKPQGLLDWPPGFCGALARYIYDSSPRPVREVAIVASLGLLAGIMGRGWNIPQSGLNLYIILIARSAIGKEAMHSGISRILSQTAGSAVGGMMGSKILEFVDFSEYVSGPALTKSISFNPVFVNVSGEWGRRLKALSLEEGRNGPLSSLRTAMTNLYQKSGEKSIVGGMAYSDKEKNVASVSGVAYSMIGETTPGTFYESLTDAMMEDGFLSRFTIIEYDGSRPEHNHQQRQSLTDQEVGHLTWIVHTAGLNKMGSGAIPVTMDEEVAQAMHQLDKFCDYHINGTTDESKRQMYNRAHLKVHRIAALLAAADNPGAPCIRIHQFNWALDVVMRDIGIMSKRLLEGDVGHGDVSRERKLMSILAEYLKTPPLNGQYGVSQQMAQHGVIPRSYLQIRVQRTPTFVQHHGGVNKALDETLKNMIDSGYIMEVQRDKMTTDYGYRGRAFRVVNLPPGYL